MPITSRDQLIAAIAGTKSFTGNFLKLGAANAGRQMSLWSAPGTLPVAGSTPAGATACNSATPGCLPVPTVGTSGNTLYLSALSVSPAGQINNLSLYDRAGHAGGFSAAVNTTTTMSLAAGARFASTAGVMAYLEVTAAGGNTTVAFTLTYTNSAGVAGRTATIGYASNTGLTSLNSFTQVPLQAGDAGVSSVQSVTVSNGGGSAGNFAVVLARPLITSAMYWPVTHRRNHTNLLDITTSPCLFFSYMGQGGTFIGNYTVAEG